MNNVQVWTDDNNMKLNEKKTKEMIITFKRQPSTVNPLLLNNNNIERVHSFKLLGVCLSDNLTWKDHVNNMYARASPRLYYLRQLRRCGLSNNDLLTYYQTMVRPILEYACPVWHAGLTIGESELLEHIQKRALKTIYYGLSYEAALQISHLDHLSARRERLSKKFFTTICDSDSKLNYLLKKRPPTNHDIRNPQLYHCPIPKTERYKGSFVIHHLLNM